MSSDDLLNVSQTVYRVPKSHWHCNLRNFDWPEDAKREALVEFLEYIESGERPPAHLLMIGRPGTGKTHLLTAIYRWAVRRTDPHQSVMLNLPQFCNEVKSSYDSGGDPFGQIKEAEFFVGVDDLFGKDHTQHEVEQIINPLIDTAYMNGAAMVITTNWDVSDLKSKLRPHEMSRIMENSKIMKFDQKDRRVSR